MKIATWNVARPTKKSKRVPLILDHLKSVDADILILTETNEMLDLGNQYNSFHSTKPQEPFYKDGEKRVSIYSKYRSNGQIETFRSDTSICINFDTPLGNISVYGTIIGINGNKRKNFITDLEEQLFDFERIAKTNNLCISGDLNMTFFDNYYFTNDGRDRLNKAFDKLGLTNLTADIPQNIDHIIVPNKFFNAKESVDTWNNPVEKKLSDHIGVFAIIS